MDVTAERAYPTPYANSTLLPMLLLSLMQQKNAPTTTNTFRQEYDFIIVGAGSAGSVVASRLSEVPCVSVLLLEAGKAPPLLSDVPILYSDFWMSDISWRQMTVPQKHTARAMISNVIIEEGKAVGVRFEHEGVTFLIRAKREVIVSAGAVNSAQLLMLSGIGPREHLEQFNIPVAANLPVGENLQDHCGTSLYFEIDPGIPAMDQKLKNTTNVEEYIYHKRGLLSTPDSNPIAFLSRELNPEVDFPDHEMVFGEATVPTPHQTYGLKPDVIKKYFGPYENATLYKCICQHLQPKSRGTVKLQSANIYDSPLIDPNYFEVPDDIRPIVEGLKTCHKIGTSEPLRRIGSKPLSEPFPGCEDYFGNDDIYYECLARSMIMSINHPCGTAKMGNPNDPTTVVDPRLRVKGIEGLRIVDASVIPIIPSGNINAPVIMIAEKASDMIKDTLNCYPQTPV